MDLSQLSDADLDAISQNNLKDVSDQGLDVIHAQSAPPPAETGIVASAKRFGNQVVEDLPTYGAMAGGVAAGLPAGAATLGLGTIPAALTGAGMGAAAGQTLKNVIKSYTAPDEAPKNLTEATKSVVGAIPGGVEQEMGGQILGAGLHKAAEMTPKVSKYLAEKFGKVYANVPEDFTKEYIERGGDIKARPADQILEDLHGKYDEAQTNLDNAKVAHESARSEAQEARQGAGEQFIDTKYQAQHAADQAKEELDRAFMEKRESLQNSNVQHLREPISKSIDELKDQVIKGSQDAMEVLGRQPGTVPIAPVVKTLDDQIAGMKINGTPVSKTAVNSIQELEQLKERLADLGEEITFPQAKAAIKQLDHDIGWGVKNGEFTPQVEQATQAVRSQFDQVLKSTSPEYAEAMKPVAQKAALLSDLSKGFGTDQQIIGKLNNIDSELGQQVHMPQLQALGQHTGQDFVTPIQNHVANMETLGTPSKMEEIKQALPQFPAYQQASQAHEALMNPAARRQVQQAPEIARPNDLLAKRQTELESAQDQANIMRPLNPQSVQSRMKALTGARNYGAEHSFADIDQATGKNYSGEIKDRAILDQFNKADTQGSRKVAAGGAIGAALGGIPGAAVGGAVGAVADKYAGQTFKAALDTGLGLQKFGKALGPYADVLQKAAARGPQAVAATNYLLQQKDSDYRKRVDLIQQQEGEQAK